MERNHKRIFYQNMKKWQNFLFIYHLCFFELFSENNHALFLELNIQIFWTIFSHRLQNMKLFLVCIKSKTLSLQPWTQPLNLGKARQKALHVPTSMRCISNSHYDREIFSSIRFDSKLQKRNRLEFTWRVLRFQS